MKKELLLFLLLLIVTSLNVTSLYGKANDGLLNTISADLIFNDTLVDLPDTVYLQTSECSTPAAFCLDIPIDEINSEYQIIVNDTSFYQNPVFACNLDTILSYNYRQLVEADDGTTISGPYNLQSWEVNGTTFSGDFMTIPALVDSLNLWDPTGNWTDNAATKRIRGGDNDNTYSDIVVFVSQTLVTPILSKNEQLIINGTQLFFDDGLTKVTLSTVQGGVTCIDSFHVAVACIQPETIVVDTLFPGVTDTICLNFAELLLPFTSITNECPDASDGNASFNLVNGNSCVEFTTLTPGLDSACFVVCDGRGLCDTTIFIIDVQDPDPSNIFETSLTIVEGRSNIFCLDTTRLMGVDTFFNICDSDEDFVDFTLDSASLCLSYTGLVGGGVDTFCVVICDEMMLCDTNFIYVQTLRNGPGLINDTIFINQENTVCNFSLDNLNGPAINIQNFCEDTAVAVDFTLDTVNYCLNIAGLIPGQDTACLQFTDNAGNVDTIYYVVDVLNPTPEIIRDDIRLDNTGTYCLDTSQLSGMITDSIFICNDFTGQAVDFVANPLSLCLEVTATNTDSRDTLCVAICDEFATCDTTTFIFNVSDLPTDSPPILSPDSDTVLINSTLTFNVCENDTIPGTIDNFFVLPIASGGVGPNQGIAFADVGDCNVTYIPDVDSCGLDQFTYVIANEFGSDTTNVTVFIECNQGTAGDLFVYSGFSPNNDNVNDFFRIRGLENFPDHVLYVYNRWGNRVLETANYQNDWGGTWEGLDLPDGTYFYLLERGDGESISGYVQMQR